MPHLEGNARSDSIEMQQLFTEPNIREIPDPILATNP
jgi:hypothetical protein